MNFAISRAGCWTPGLSISRILTREGAAVPVALHCREVTPAPPPARRSVMVGWSLVLAPRLLVVAALAQRSPVAAVPEESRVASVRNDMVHHCGLCVLASLHTLLAEWMRTKKLLACFLPCAAVATAGSGPHLLWVQRLVYVTVLGTGRDQCSATGMPARYLGFHRHTQHLLQSPPNYVPTLLQVANLPVRHTDHCSQGRSGFPKCP